ncbi:hypothetical protein MNBD_GAMMA22-2245 [hydrothermal vent metagenome]|uniref:Calx-beta domain-containing protein n=1 Tax=hydrothermal vent metagenome TaxID=652676 RepID=A0A3B1AG13_9ZZZZ
MLIIPISTKNIVNRVFKFNYLLSSLLFLFFSLFSILSVAAPTFTGNTQKFDLGESGLNDMVAADFNQDGVMDVIISEYDGGANGSGVAAIEIRFGDVTGTGDFSNNLSLSGPTTGDGLTFNPDGLAVGDVDADGVLDVVITAGLSAPDINNTHLKTLIFKGEITGAPDNKKYALLAATPITIETPVPAHDVVIGFFNNDKFVDVVIAHELGLSLYTGTGAGVFSTTEVRIATSGSSNYATKIFAIDINNDQILDIITDREVLLNDYATNNSFVRQVAYGSLSNPPAKFKNFTIGDFNNDKLIDVAYVLYYTTLAESELVILQAESNGIDLNYIRKTAPKFTATSITALTSGDVDLDGNIDVLMTDYTQDAVYIFSGIGDGTFSTPTKVIIPPAINALPTIKPKLLVAINANSDRLLDIVTANDVDGQSSSLSVLLQDAPANELVVFERKKYEIAKPESNQDLTITVTRKYASATPPEITLLYRVKDGTAKNGIDFIAPTIATDLVFAAGQLTQSFIIKIVATNANVAVKNFTISLTEPSGLLVPANEFTTVSITNNNIELPLISFEFTNFERNEDSSLANAFVSLTRTLPAGFQNTETSVYLSTQVTSDLSAASAGKDFTPIIAANLQAPNIIFKANQTVAKLAVPIKIINDTIFEATEIFRVVLSQALNGTIASTNTATVTIIDDDIAPVNTIPIARKDSYTVVNDQLLTVRSIAGVLNNDFDNESNSLTANLIQDTAQVGDSLTLNFDGSFIYQPVLGFIGEVTFQYSVNDGMANSLPAIVTITVTKPAQEPIINSSGGGGGGCIVILSAHFDPVLPILLLISLYYVFRHRKFQNCLADHL